MVLLCVRALVVRRNGILNNGLRKVRRLDTESHRRPFQQTGYIMTSSQDKRPSELRVSKDRSILTISFGGEKPFELPAEALRVMSPSAEVQGHSPAQRVTVPGKRHVQIIGVEQVGNYAVKIRFDDMHDTGIFTWTYLYDLGSNLEQHWAGYLQELADKGMTRDRSEKPR
tara:strand:+ start:7858 stop:8367 length:510 start_codon:yes stop_codon:yes gene_type:complete